MTYTVEAEVTYRTTFEVEAPTMEKAYEMGHELAKTEGSVNAIIIDGPNVVVLQEH